MNRLALVSLLLLAVLLATLALACSGEDTSPPFIITVAPPPTETPLPDQASTGQASGTSQAPADGNASTETAPDTTPSPTGEDGGLPPPAAPLHADDLGHLPDDPTELMYSTLDISLLDVGRKMAYSHNDEFIPVIMEFMRFQTDDESLLTLSSFLVRIRDKIPEGEFAVVPFGEESWSWWVKWLSQNPEIKGPEGFDGWKGVLFSFIDPPMGEFMYDGVPTNIRLEEIVWGGVRRDGIPDLQFPPAIAPEDARYLDPSDRVFGVSINDEHRAYPLRVLNPHEMANDILGGVQFALAY